MPTDIPSETTRWRCSPCGNLTQFDVIRSHGGGVLAPHHGGEPDVSEVRVQSEVLDRVACRWCGATDRIEVIPRPSPEAAAEDHPGEIGGP